MAPRKYLAAQAVNVDPNVKTVIILWSVVVVPSTLVTITSLYAFTVQPPESLHRRRLTVHSPIRFPHVQFAT
jgi:hypothetical protein